jgi:hypothetical protein
MRSRFAVRIARMNALQNSGASDGLSGLLEWSEPVIFDCSSEVYRLRVAERTLIGKLARVHSRAWRALIAGDMSDFVARRRELIAVLGPVGLGARCVAEADARILIELSDIVAARFQRCGRIARGYRLALSELAQRLAPIAKAA